jgi:uncharacterized membrane protein YeaQ/YmgE (transglycosylase-associated protein family)
VGKFRGAAGDDIRAATPRFAHWRQWPIRCLALTQGRSTVSRSSFLNQIFRKQEAAVSILAWIILGLIAGFVASKIVNKTGEGVVLDIVLGIVGAVIGGWLFNNFGMAGVTGLNIYSLLVAVVGAVVVLLVYHLLVRRPTV